MYSKAINDIINFYGGIDGLLDKMKQIIFDCLPISIIAAGGDSYMLNQIITTAGMMQNINSKE